MFMKTHFILNMNSHKNMHIIIRSWKHITHTRLQNMNQVTRNSLSQDRIVIEEKDKDIGTLNNIVF